MQFAKTSRKNKCEAEKLEGNKKNEREKVKEADFARH